ncbi:MAG: HIRAN domain-containing protein [Clostridiales bacterium]|nr:HIRAN domain-containing protein [Clostridiales bacterium]HBM80810.1 hypothetical protein [Clostridiaceae bacterium]
MRENYFITITGLNHYYDKVPFEIGRILKIVKEPQNEYDDEAIRVELPYIGTVGYVANSSDTVFKGTISSGRLYDRIGDYAYVQVCFITHSNVIALVLSPKEVEKNSKEEEVQEIVKKLKTMIK